MTTMTLARTRRTTWPVGLVLGSLAGTALVAAGVWNVLIQAHVTVSAPPHISEQVPPMQTMRIYYTWYAGTVPQERADTIAALIGVTALVVVAVELRRRLASDALGRGGCTALQAGGLVWLVGALTQLGGHHAVALMATHSNPIQTVNVVAFTTDVTSDAFSAASFVLLAAGLLALAANSFGGQGWSLLSVLTGVLAVVVAYGYIAGIDAITTYQLGLLAAVLLPVWLVWTGRRLDRTEPSA
jgi:hypothetical protein